MLGGKGFEGGDVGTGWGVDLQEDGGVGVALCCADVAFPHGELVGEDGVEKWDEEEHFEFGVVLFDALVDVAGGGLFCVGGGGVVGVDDVVVGRRHCFGGFGFWVLRVGDEWWVDGCS